MPRRKQPEDMWLLVDRSDPDGCWEWQGTRVDGYGQFRAAGHRGYAHRLAFTLTYGPIPPGKFVCHHCDNPACVRPDHLYAGDAQTNSDDMWGRGRAAYPLGSKRPDVTQRLTRALGRAGLETTAVRTEDVELWRRLDFIDATKELSRFVDRIAHGGRLPELVS